MTKRIVVLGPESTGKSTLCTQLAQHYATLWVPEYAREHLLREGMSYTYEDLLVIAERQLESEDAITANTPGNLLFIDTDMYVMKVWCEFVFGRCHQWILDQVVKRTYHLYLLCDTDLEWTKDALREYPDLHMRRWLFHMYRDIMINQRVPWSLIRGGGEERLAAAIEAVDGIKNRE